MAEGSAVSCDDVHAHQFLIGGFYRKRRETAACFGSAFFWGLEKYENGEIFSVVRVKVMLQLS